MLPRTKDEVWDTKFNNYGTINNIIVGPNDRLYKDDK